MTIAAFVTSIYCFATFSPFQEDGITRITTKISPSLSIAPVVAVVMAMVVVIVMLKIEVVMVARVVKSRARGMDL